MRDRYKILAAKEMQRGLPKKGMVQIASFRYDTDALRMWKDYSEVTMRDWYLQLVDRKDILDVHEPATPVTGHLSMP